MPPDPTECGCMKTIVLFKPDTASLQSPRNVELLQDQAQCILADYVRNRYISQPTRYHPPSFSKELHKTLNFEILWLKMPFEWFRFGRLLLVIPLLRMVRANLVETLFFRETVGETNIKNIILDLYKCDKLPSL